MGIVARGAEGLSNQRRRQREAQRREHRNEAPRYTPRQRSAGPMLRTSGASDPARHTRPPEGLGGPIAVFTEAALASPEGL